MRVGRGSGVRTALRNLRMCQACTELASVRQRIRRDIEALSLGSQRVTARGERLKRTASFR